MTPDAQRRAHASSFGAAAAEYERGRPPYPPQAIDWLIPAGVTRVLDLGAGTGKLTRQIRERGLEVTAVEPLAGMRAQLREAVPGIAVLDGTAEHIPLADQSTDVVLVAQAWHWVEPSEAVPEVARVLAPGGRLGLLWNIRDERLDWMARLGVIMRSHEGLYPESNTISMAPTVGPPFGPVERFDVEWVHRLPADALVDMVASRSYVITRPAAERAAVLDEVRHLLGTHPALVGADEIELPYVTRCARTNLPP